MIRLIMVAKFTKSDDPLEGTITRVQYVYWGVIEIVTAILCANIPAMPPLIRQGLHISNRLRSKYHVRFWVHPTSGSGGRKANGKTDNYKNIDSRKRDGSCSDQFSGEILSQPSVVNNKNSSPHHHQHYRSTLNDEEKQQRDDYPVLSQTRRATIESGMKQNSTSTVAAKEIDIELASYP